MRSWPSGPWRLSYKQVYDRGFESLTSHQICAYRIAANTLARLASHWGSSPYRHTKFAGLIQRLECLPSKQNVTGSSPVPRSKIQRCTIRANGNAFFHLTVRWHPPALPLVQLEASARDARRAQGAHHCNQSTISRTLQSAQKRDGVSTPEPGIDGSSARDGSVDGRGSRQGIVFPPL